MRIEMVVASVVILLARQFGKWRAKVWFKAFVSSLEDGSLGERVPVGHDRSQRSDNLHLAAVLPQTLKRF